MPSCADTKLSGWSWLGFKPRERRGGKGHESRNVLVAVCAGAPGKGWALSVEVAVGTLGDARWHQSWSEASRSVWGIKGPQNVRRGPRAVPVPAGAGGAPPAEAGPCDSAVPTANGRCGEQLGARLQWRHPRLFLSPRAQASQQSFRIPWAEQTAAMCLLGWGNAAWGARVMPARSSRRWGVPFAPCPPIPAQGSPLQPQAEKAAFSVAAGNATRSTKRKR